jgi:phosphate acetyltransferase
MATEFVENRIYDEIQPGQTAEFQRTLTRDDVALFSKVSGDLNPTHVDEAYAIRSGAKGIVGHSLWATGLISSLLANVLPGPGTVYRGQDARFHRPVHLGDTVTARIKVREKREGSVVVFDCEVLNQDRELVMNGVAEVVAPKERIRVERPSLPEVSVRHHDSFKVLMEAVDPVEPIATAVVHPCDLWWGRRPRSAGWRSPSI